MAHMIQQNELIIEQVLLCQASHLQLSLVISIAEECID